MNKRQIFIDLGLILCAILGLWIVFDHIGNFLYANYLNEHPDLTVFVGVNVVSPWADFTYFTYITVIIFSLWCIGFALSSIFSWQKLNNFFRKDSVVCFIFCNYLLTISLYSFYQIFEHFPFGWFANSPIGWHSFGTSIIVHYVFFAIECIIFAKIKTNHSNHKKCHIYSSLFLITYYVTVKIVGEFAFKIRFFPYIIFDAKTFGTLVGISSYGWSVVLLVFVCCILFFVYQVLLHLLLKIKNKK